MEQEINVEAVLKGLREIIGNQAQEIAILKSLLNTTPNP
jgi:hypothetical protein